MHHPQAGQAGLGLDLGLELELEMATQEPSDTNPKGPALPATVRPDSVRPGSVRPGSLPPAPPSATGSVTAPNPVTAPASASAGGRRGGGRGGAGGGDEAKNASTTSRSFSPTSLDVVTTQIFTVSYLIFFSLLGTLARLGLQALTTYPDMPVTFTSVWPNLGGSLIIGFLAEDLVLFEPRPMAPGSGSGRGGADDGLALDPPTGDSSDVSPDAGPGPGPDADADADVDADLDIEAGAAASLAAVKKEIPLYIGLASGFCGSFTSFSAFVRDMFLAPYGGLLGGANTAGDAAQSTTIGGGGSQHQNGGYSFMAFAAVLLATVSLSLGAVRVGAHLAAASQTTLHHVRFRLGGLIRRAHLDRLAVVAGWGCWAAAIALSASPPAGQEQWRGQAIFALAFAPLGCLARFYTSLALNVFPRFPLGTFAVNVAGTAVLAACWDMAHVPLGGVVGCQVLQGVEDGFCGCLTTVSTWVAELTAMRRKRDAYAYATASVGVALVLALAIMGGMGWSGVGFAPLACSH